MNERTKALFKMHGWKLKPDPDAALRRAMARIDAERFEFARKLNEARANLANEELKK